MAPVDPQEVKTWRVVWLGAIDSTIREAARRAHDGERGPLWIFAERQHAGRGRRGRAWTSEPGNLYASLLFKPPCAPRFMGQLPFIASLALYDAICRLAPAASEKLTLKWPNDLLLGGAKLSGILIESSGSGADHLVVIGCGVNCVTHPLDTPYPATDLAAAGHAVTARALADELPAAFERWLGIWRGGANFAHVRAAWLERASGLGQAMIANLNDARLEGRFEGLGPDGQLLLRLSSGQVQKILAGDVYPVLAAVPDEARQ